MTLRIPNDAARFEVKYIGRPSTYNHVIEWLTTHVQGFKKAYPNRQINNIYFDTVTYQSYQDNISGESSRTKVRYRWYGASLHPVNGCLEIKQKRNVLSWKKIFKIENLHIDQTDSWQSIKYNLREKLNLNGQIWLDHYTTPIMINRYHREYFISKDGKIRVTIDKNQSVFEQRFLHNPNYKNKTLIPEIIVVEIKFSNDHRDLASDITQNIPLRISRNSKYMMAVNAIAWNG